MRREGMDAACHAATATRGHIMVGVEFHDQLAKLAVHVYEVNAK